MHVMYSLFLKIFLTPMSFDIFDKVIIFVDFELTQFAHKFIRIFIEFGTFSIDAMY